MQELDLGSVRVALTVVPTGAGKPDGGQAADVQTVHDEDDPALDSFTKPASLPGGLSLFEATVIKAPVQMTVATYFDPETGRAVTLAQTAVASLQSKDGGKATVFAPGAELEEADLKGTRAARVTISDDPNWRGSRTSFVWVSGLNVYQLSGRGTSDAELAEVAANI